MKIYNIAFFGAGEIALKVAHTIEKIIRLKVYGVASRSLTTTKKFAALFENIHIFNTYDDLLNDSKIDLVYISTPTKFHYENIKSCLLSNKNVICEKPICEFSSQLEELITIAKSRSLILIDGLWSQYMPMIEYLKTTISELKGVHFAYASLGYPSLKKINEKLISKYDIWDYEIYPVSILLRLFGVPEDIKTNKKLINNIEVVSKRKMFYSDKICITRASLLHRYTDLIIIIGEKGLVICRRYWFGNRSFFVYKWPFNFKRYRKQHIISGYEYEFYEAIKCLDNGSLSDLYPLEYAISYLKVKESN